MSPVSPCEPSDDPQLIARLLALDPQGLGGLCLRGPAGPWREAWLASLRALWPEPLPWRRLPLQIDDSSLDGGLDLGASLAAGRPVQRSGLLAQSRGGVLLLPMAERAEPGLATRLALATEQGCTLIAFDEARPEDERPLAAALSERLALIIGPERPAPGQALPWPAEAREAARARLQALPFDAACVHALSLSAQALGLRSLRPVWQAWRVACAAAACAGRSAVSQLDAELAARLVLAPRAQHWPAPAEVPAEGPSRPPGEAAATPPDPAETPPPVASAVAPSSPETSHAAPAEAQPQPEAPEAQAERLLAAAAASLPPGLLAALAGTQAPQRPAARSGGRQGPCAVGRRGRRLAARPTPGSGQARLDLLATLRAAVPWQRVRQREAHAAGRDAAPRLRLRLRREDLRYQRHQQAQRCTTIFVVDASGSQALQRLAEAKGAVELLLADCYVRRDQVALLAFRGTAAELLLPPTRSLLRARRALAGLPGGGGTPLALGIEAASQLALRLQARGEGRAQLVFLTDARANIDRLGQPGREAAQRDALQAARTLASRGLPCLLIDTAARPQAQAQVIAQAMHARYLALPPGSPQAVSAAVRALA